MTEIASRIRHFVFENFLFGDRSAALGDGDSFLEKGIVDSTGVLELIAFIEKDFHVSFDDADLVPENLDSVENVAGFVLRKRAAAAKSAA